MSFLGLIYKIVFPNGKHYIGLTTTSLEQRTREHVQCAKSGKMHVLYNAIRHYNVVDTLELVQIDTADSIEELCEKENWYITKYNSYYQNKQGYNMTYGGEGTNGYVFTEEDRKKKGEAMKKYYENNPDARKKHSEKMKKHFENNLDAVQKNSEGVKRYFENPDARKKQSEILKKYYENNLDARKKISERMKHRSQECKYKRADKLGQNKPFDIFTTDGTFVKTFNYQFEANDFLRKEHNVTTLIGQVLRGRQKSSAGFVFKYTQVNSSEETQLVNPH